MIMTQFKNGDRAILHSTGDNNIDNKIVTVVGEVGITLGLYIIMFDEPVGDWSAYSVTPSNLKKITDCIAA